VVLFVVVVLWAIVLGPLAWQKRADARKNRSIDAFRRRMARLAPAEPLAARPAVAARPAGSAPPAGATVVRIAPPAPPAPPPRPAPPREVVLRRHRRLVAGLLVAMAATLVLGVLPPLRGFWGLHLMLDTAFVAYAAVLRRRRRGLVEQAAKVRYLPEPAERPPLRRSASS
jgi:hypothetical protein